MAAPLPAVRRLAAIVIADVVGFSRHMERDDAGTLARLRALRADVVDPALVRNAGHVVKTAGDGMLIEFASADAALRFAVELQGALLERNATLAEDERIEYRIGINLGDIIVDGADIAGDGVNVASRLEALAPPGGICVSSAVREQVHGSLAVGFDDIGDQQVKNIMRPIRVYQVRMEGAGPPPLAARATPRARWRLGWPLAGLAAVVVACAAGLMWLKPWNAAAPAARIASVPAMSIAILPFSFVPGREGDRGLGDGLGDELASDFSQARWYKVVARAFALSWLGRWDEAWSANQRAMSLEPTNRWYVIHSGWIRLRTGHATESLAIFEQGLAMDPRRDAWPLHFICKAQLLLGRYAEAAASCESAAALNNGWINQLYLCAAYAQNGDSAKAAVAKAALLDKKPGYTIATYRRAYAASPPAFFDLVDRHLAAGLRKAGIADR